MTKLDEYFDRARRAEPPLQKDEVSSILAEKLKQRSDDDDAHRRYKSVFSRGVGRIFSLLSPKGWIMLSMLTSAVVAFMLLLPGISRNTRIEKTPKTQSAPAMTTNRPNNNQIINNQANKPEVARSQATKPQIASNQTTKPQVTNKQAVADSLPAPYDFVPVDVTPVIDIKELLNNVVYPEEAKKLGLEGTVDVRILVLPNGTASPKSFIINSNAKILNQAALNAVISSSYTPAKRDGKPTACWVSIPIIFRLHEKVSSKNVKKAEMLSLTEEELSRIGVKSLENGMIEIAGGGDGDHDFLRIQGDIFSRLSLVELLKDSTFIHVGAPAFKQIFEFFPPAQVKRMRVGHAEFLIDKQTAKNLGLEHIPLPRLVNTSRGEKYYINSKGFTGDRASIKKFFENMVAQQSKTNEQAAKDYPQLKAQEDSAKEVMRSLLDFQQEKSDISKLIGIRIVSKQARSEGDEYLLWYDPTPEFIALLPERYRVGLEREVEAAKKYATKCEIPTEAERKAVPGYFDSWRSCDGTLKITSIFPNPADVKATVRFTLQEARSITVTVHNLNGERLAILEPTPVLPAGEHELPLDFTGRNIGVYLLALSTDKNETAIKRVMIVR